MRVFCTVTLAVAVAVLEAAAGARAADAPQLINSDPYRLIAGTAPAQISISGKNFYDIAGVREQHMHWQIHRDDGPWQVCNAPSGDRACFFNGWTAGLQTIALGPYWVARPGFVEFRAWTGLAMADASDPSQAAPGVDASGWSNVLRVPVVTAGGTAPSIRSLSKKVFPLSGDDTAYQFTIDAANVDRSTRIVYRGDVVVYPGRIDEGHLVLTAVPPVYRRTTPGQLEVQLRTDSGGLSNTAWITFAAPAPLPVMRPGSLPSITVAASPSPLPVGRGSVVSGATTNLESRSSSGNQTSTANQTSVSATASCDPTVIYADDRGLRSVRSVPRGLALTLEHRPAPNEAFVALGGAAGENQLTVRAQYVRTACVQLR